MKLTEPEYLRGVELGRALLKHCSGYGENEIMIACASLVAFQAYWNEVDILHAMYVVNTFYAQLRRSVDKEGAA